GQGLGRRGSEALDERGQDAAVQRPRLLAFGRAPGFELGTGRKLEALEKLAAEELRRPLELRERNAGARLGAAARDEHVDFDPGRVERHRLPVAGDARLLGVVAQTA